MEQEPLPDSIGIVDGEEVVFEEVANDESGQYIYDYDGTFNMPQEKNLLFDLYQPEETVNGTYICKICLRTGKEVEFEERNAFVAHRYKFHGSYNNNVICPLRNCREVFASVATLRRHLTMSHTLPIEVHQQAFANIGEFEKWRHLVELSSGCRFMMHTKQPKYRRQVMHCSRSEHKLVLQTQKHRLPRYKMEKSGSCCPAHVSFRVDAKTGQVHCFCQLYHIGHDSGGADPEAALINHRPADIYFPMKPKLFGTRAMQFLQIDVFEMNTAVYGSTVYENILLVHDLKTGYLWARPLSEVSRSVITRILTSIFTEYGIPEGFGTSYSPTVVRETMKSIESIFVSEILEVWIEPPFYEQLEQWLMVAANDELGSSNRWVEQVQFVVMEYNQKVSDGGMSPFERMFNRKPPKLYEPDEDTINLENCLEPDETVSMPIVYKPGERVYLRRQAKKPCRGGNVPYYYGLISEVDKDSEFFPYKVHYSASSNPWPNESNTSVWCSAFDILPTTHRIKAIGEEERRKVIESMFCSCNGEYSNEKYNFDSMNPLSSGTGVKCMLYRNILCENRMSRVCCRQEGTNTCLYHDLYPENDDSYVKLEIALSNYHKVLKEREEGHVATRKQPAIENHPQPSTIPETSVSSDRPNEEEEEIEIEVTTSPIEFEKKVVVGVKEEPPTKTVNRKRRNKGEAEKEYAPVTKSSKSEESLLTRRASNRKSVKPKILADYVDFTNGRSY